MGMTDSDNAKLDARLARTLGPDAEDTAALSRAVLTRLAGPEAPRRPPLAEVLAAPLPVTGLMSGLLLFAVALGYRVAPVDLDEVTALVQLLGPGF
jgi:hypothetical protein